MIILTDLDMVDQALLQGIKLLLGGSRASEKRVKQASEALKHVKSDILIEILSQPNLPDKGMSELEIRHIINSLSLIDSNNLSRMTMYYIILFNTS